MALNSSREKNLARLAGAITAVVERHLIVEEAAQALVTQLLGQELELAVEHGLWITDVDVTLCEDGRHLVAVGITANEDINLTAGFDPPPGEYTEADAAAVQTRLREPRAELMGAKFNLPEWLRAMGAGGSENAA